MFSFLSRAARSTGVHLHALPDGFFLNDLLWFGDGAGQTIPVARGFEIVPADPSGLGIPGMVDLRYRLQQTLAMLGSTHRMQVRWVTDSDYRRELTVYDNETARVEEELSRREQHGQSLEAWTVQVYHRRWLHQQAWTRMVNGQLQRERLHVFISSSVPVPSRGARSRADHAQMISRIAQAEAKRIEDDFGKRLRAIHADAYVRPMTDADHFMRAEYFHDPLRPFALGSSPLERLDRRESIGINSFVRQWRVPQGEPGVSYTEDNVPHALLALMTLPTHTEPVEIVEKIRHLDFHDVEVIMNIKPLDAMKVATRLEKESGEATKILEAQGHLRVGENARVDDKNARILAYRRGERIPYGVSMTLHLWAATPTELARRVSAIKILIEGWRTAGASLVCLPGSVRHVYANAWPGWLCGTHEEYYLDTDDINTADMMPWSSTFVGEPEGAEVLFNGPRDSLVFMRTREPNGQPRHMLTFGKTGSGKTTFTNDWVLQVRHTFDFVGICESGRSLIVSSALEGVKPLVISPSGTETLNVFDPNNVPLSHEFFSFLTNFLLGRMGLGKAEGSVLEKEEVEIRRSLLLKNLHAVYRQNFMSVRRSNGEFGNKLQRFAALVHKRQQGHVARSRDMSFADVAVLINSHIEGHDVARQQLAVEAYASVTGEEIEAFMRLPDSQTALRDLAYMFFDPMAVPTMGSFVDTLENAPTGDRADQDVCKRMANLLRPWCAKGGSYGVLFDGPGTVRIEKRRFHVETGDIDDSARGLRDAVVAVVAGMMMQHVKRLPRAQRKLLHFPELAELLNTPGGPEMLLLLSTQFRKYNGTLSAEIQQYDLLEKSSVQTTLWANCSQRYYLRQEDREDVAKLSRRARLSSAHTRMIEDFPPPAVEGGHFLLNVGGGVTGPAISRPSPGLLYLAESSGRTFDERRDVLNGYDSLAQGIIMEGESAAQRAEQAKMRAHGGSAVLAAFGPVPGRDPARELLGNG